MQKQELEKKALINASDLLKDLEELKITQNSPGGLRHGNYRCKTWPRWQYIYIARGTRDNPTLPISLHYNMISETDEIYKTIDRRLRDKGLSVEILEPGMGMIYTTANVEAKSTEEFEEFIKIVKSCFGRIDDEFYRHTPGGGLFESPIETGDIVFYISWLITTFLIFAIIGRTFEFQGFWIPFLISAPLGLIGASAIFALISKLAH